MTSISQELNDLFNPKPADEYDPENDFADDRLKKKNEVIKSDLDFEQRHILPEIPLNPKFAAKKVSRKELEGNEESSQEESEENDENMENEEKESLSIEEEVKNKEEESDKEIDAALEAINEEDQIQTKKAEKYTRLSEIERGQQVILQRKVTDGLIGIRILMEKILNTANRLPQTTTIEQFKENPDVESKYTSCIEGIKEFFSTLLSIQDLIARQSEISSELQKPKENPSLDELWKVMEKNKLLIKEQSYDIVENWMEKAQVYANAKLKHNVKTLGVHPLRQTEEKYSKNKQKMIQKAQTKSKAYKVLGNESSTIHDMIDKEIYDDSDFYQTFLRDYLALNSKSAAGSKEEELNWTYKYLQSKGIAKKEKVGAPLIESKKRKNKTLKYVVHEQLINFMAQQENHDLFPGYKNVVSNLFGLKKDEAPEKRRRIGTDELEREMENIENKEDEGMDVALI